MCSSLITMPYDTRLNPKSATPEEPTIGDLKADIEKLSDRLCNKIDAMLVKISDMEVALQDTSDRALNLEKNELPKLRKKHETDISEIEKKLLRMEIYQRKTNLLFYGVPQKEDENVFVSIRKAIKELGISSKMAEKMTFVNAHRLPRRANNNADGASTNDRGPDPIIVKFAIMTERQAVLEAYHARSKSATDGEGQANDQESTNPRSRISVRTDLPPTLKFRRGKLSSIAYKMRKEKNLSTKIFVQDTEVVLQYKEKNTREWKTYTED